jgi:hypothetical protein
LASRVTGIHAQRHWRAGFPWMSGQPHTSPGMT